MRIESARFEANFSPFSRAWAAISLVAGLGREIGAVPPGTQREIVVPVAKGWFAVAFVADRRRDEAVETSLLSVSHVRLGAELIDEPARAHDRFEDGFEKGPVLRDAIHIGRDADEFALRVIFDIATVSLIDGAVGIEDRRHEAAWIDPLAYQRT